MARIDLAYGHEFLPFDYDEDQFEVLAAPAESSSPLSDVEVGAAFDSPIGSPPLDDIVKPGESVLIVVSDATRATASAQIVNLLVRRLIQYGIAPSDIVIIFATGIHRPVTENEQRELLGPFIAQRIRTIPHDANDASQMLSLGVHEGGWEIEVNQALRGYSHVIVTGGIGFHYFAGFTGGRKSICPGLAAAATVRSTHMLALDFDTGGRREGVGAGKLAGNAVHEACDNVAALVNPAFAINVVVDSLGRAVKVYAGHWRESHRVACADYRASHSVPVVGKREVVVASCGGHPYDINLIQAHKTIDMAAAACVEGGTIVILAECGDGLGRADFLKWFEVEHSSSLGSVLRDRYEVNGQTAWALLSKAEKYKIVLVSKLAASDVARMRMTPAQTLEEAIRDVPTAKGFVLPHGARFLPDVTGS